MESPGGRRLAAIIIAVGLVTATSVLAKVRWDSEVGTPTGFGYVCGPADTIEEQAEDDGLTILDFHDDITAPTVIVPEDEVWRLHGNTTITATSAFEIHGSVTTAAEEGDRSLLIDSPKLVLNGNLSTSSGERANLTLNETDSANRTYSGQGGEDGGDIYLKIDEFEMDESACLASGDGGNGTEVIAFNRSIGNVTDDTIENVTYIGGDGGEGGDIYYPDDMTGGFNGSVWLANGGAGGRAVANYSYNPEVPQNISSFGGNGGDSGFGFAVEDQSDIGFGFRIDNGSRAEDIELLSGSGIAGSGGGAVVPITNDSQNIPIGCQIYEPLCDGLDGDPDETDKICGPSGGPGTEGSDGEDATLFSPATDGGDGGDGDSGGDGDEAGAKGGDGGDGTRDGGDGGWASAASGCGGNGGLGGPGGDGGEPGGDGGLGGSGGYPGAAGDAVATGGNGGDGNWRNGGHGGDAEATAGNTGDSGHGAPGGNGGCGDGVGGDGGAGAGASVAGTGDAEATGGNGGDGVTNGGDGGDVWAYAADGPTLGDGGTGGDGGLAAGNGGSGGNSLVGGAVAVADPGGGGTGTYPGADGTIEAEEDGADGSYGEDGTGGTTC